MVFAGAFDSFGYKRTQFFLPCQSGLTFLDELVNYADLYKRDKEDNTVSLFGDAEELKPVRPAMPEAMVEEDALALLQKEKELVGMYLSSHPLEKYSFEIENFTNTELAVMQQQIDECRETISNLDSPVQAVKDIQARIDSYDRVLQNLMEMTAAVEQNLASVKNEAAVIDRVTQKLNRQQKTAELLESKIEEITKKTPEKSLIEVPIFASRYPPIVVGATIFGSMLGLISNAFDMLIRFFASKICCNVQSTYER